MPLQLDTRQRAMLAEMGVRVWLPQTHAVESPGANASADPTPDLIATTMPVLDGVQQRDVSTHASAPVPQQPTARATGRALQAGVVLPIPQAATQHAVQNLALQELDASALVQAAAQCQACGLCAGRKNTTLAMSAAPVQTDWMVVGDPPDEDEDRLGQPFAEQAGQLLDNMLKAVSATRTGAARQGAYLSNVVKCRPPQGRVPQAAELAQCAQYLQREIALVQPKIILAMGRFATQLLLAEYPEQAAQPLGRQRGTVYRYHGIPVVVTYHPKVLLRASLDKGKAWADLCLAMDVLEACLQ